MTHPSDQLPGEPDSVYQSFREFLALGETRSPQQVWPRFRDREGSGNGVNATPQFWKFVTSFKWRERAAQCDLLATLETSTATMPRPVVTPASVLRLAKLVVAKLATIPDQDDDAGFRDAMGRAQAILFAWGHNPDRLTGKMRIAFEAHREEFFQVLGMVASEGDNGKE